MSEPYHYPVDNSDIIRRHDLEPHFEGGYFKQTLSLSSTSPPSHVTGLTPVIRDSQGRVRVQHASGSAADVLAGGHKDEHTAAGAEATCIYYLITPASSRGRMHMNDHATFHLHHAGRALYTLIQPTAGRPVVHKVIMGSNSSKGEVTQLFVPGGWWKASEIPEEDLVLLKEPHAQGLEERIGCLISEVVVPGWTMEQHKFLTEDTLKAMWAGQHGWEEYTRYLKGANHK